MESSLERLVVLNGRVYRLTINSYRILLDSIANGRAFFLPAIGEEVGDIASDVSRMNPMEARKALDREAGRCSTG